MDTKRFELTREELEECYKEWPQDENLTLFQLVARKVIAKVLARFGPPEDKVEAVASEIFYPKPPEDWGGCWEKARKILKLFPEYEPVELEALGDEEIKKILPRDYNVCDLDIALIQAAIQKNQSKGQLFRVKKEKGSEIYSVICQMGVSIFSYKPIFPCADRIYAVQPFYLGVLVGICYNVTGL